jgi:hypothetical protein
MGPDLPEDIGALLDRVATLSQWERAELGRRLRRNGLTYSEIGALIPAAKSTIAGWCRDIELSPEQIAQIRTRTGSRRGIPRDTQHARRSERCAILEAARLEAANLIADPNWLAGVMLYWGEGFKTENALGLANSDVDLVRLFMAWTRRYHEPGVRFRAKLNLHAGNDERGAIAFWSTALSLPIESFTKTFIKADGTGHRRNHLEHGVIQVRARKSTDHYLRTSGWILGVREVWNSQRPPY